MTMNWKISPSTLYQWLLSKEEVALLDIREVNAYGQGHIFMAINVPYSRLELGVNQCVPDRTAKIVLIDENGVLAEHARDKLTRFGFLQVLTVAGGMHAWCTEGYDSYDGTYVLEHAFGLFVVDQYQTPSISASELMKIRENGEDALIIDTRPFDAYTKGTIPGSINIPLGELAVRFSNVVRDRHERVVVHCAGLTRGALGAQTLINLGIANPVAVLWDGTKGWGVAGGQLEHHATREAPESSENVPDFVQEFQEFARDHYPITFVSIDHVREQTKKDNQQSFLMIDIRTREEHLTDPLAASVWIPGGELIGMTQDHLALRNMDLCLVGNGDGRAEIIAGWLLEQGWPSVSIMEDTRSYREMGNSIPERVDNMTVATEGNVITPIDLKARMENENVVVIDFSSSQEFAMGHIPGSWWMSPASLTKPLYSFPTATCIVATSSQSRLAQLATIDLAQFVSIPVFSLDGGMEAWIAEGYPQASGLTRTLGPIDDVYWEFAELPSDDIDTLRATWRRIVEWRAKLRTRYSKDPIVPFVRFDNREARKSMNSANSERWQQQ